MASSDCRSTEEGAPCRNDVLNCSSSSARQVQLNTRAIEKGANPSRLSKNMQEPYITSDTN
ncbi:hypothetical protein EMIT0215P_10253 [Pseudomonas serboccidentalis]